MRQTDAMVLIFDHHYTTTYVHVVHLPALECGHVKSSSVIANDRVRAWESSESEEKVRVRVAICDPETTNNDQLDQL